MVRDEMSFFVKRHELADGSSYVGGYERGKANGQGRRTWPNGDIYEGNFKDGVMEGYGVLTWHDGSRYEGDWANGKRQGRGDYKTPEGDHYNGIWQDDKRHGKGKQIEVRQRLLSLPVGALIQSLSLTTGSDDGEWCWAERWGPVLWGVGGRPARGQGHLQERRRRLLQRPLARRQNERPRHLHLG